MFLAIWFRSSSLKQFQKFQNHNVWFQKQWLGSFAWKVIVCTTKDRGKLLEMGKKLKIKHSVSCSPYKVQENFCHKKAFHRKTNFLGQIFWGMFYMGANDQIMQGGKLMVKKFQRSGQVSFSSHSPWPGLLIYHLKSWHHN